MSALDYVASPSLVQFAPSVLQTALSSVNIVFFEPTAYKPDNLTPYAMLRLQQNKQTTTCPKLAMASNLKPLQLASIPIVIALVSTSVYRTQIL